MPLSRWDFQVSHMSTVKAWTSRRSMHKHLHGTYFYVLTTMIPLAYCSFPMVALPRTSAVARAHAAGSGRSLLQSTVRVSLVLAFTHGVMCEHTHEAYVQVAPCCVCNHGAVQA